MHRYAKNIRIVFCIAMFCIIRSYAFAQAIFPKNIADSLPKSSVYFVGQLHYNKANAIVEQELLLALNVKYGLRYDILEFPHSVAFLLNQYLLTGQDSFLTFIHPAARFPVVRAVKQYNDRTDSTNHISFYGIDFENRSDGKFTRKAVELISGNCRISPAEPLQELMTRVYESPAAEMKGRLANLKEYLKKNETISKKLLKHYYLDLYLITNAQFDFSPNRDDAMFNNFNFLYKALSLTGDKPGFLASFGTGHINPGNNKGLSMRLSENPGSPVRNSVSIIGIQYLNCSFKNEGYKENAGSMDFLCAKNSVRESLKVSTGAESIGFITAGKLKGLNCSKNIRKMSGLIVVSNYSAVTNYGD